MLRQKAFIDNNKMLKGALHCHTTRSDGRLEPDYVERYCKAHGYDFVALTDHRRYNYKDYAPELGLTIIPAMEFDATFLKEQGRGFRTFHTVVLGPDDETNGYKQDDYFDSGKVLDQHDMQYYVDQIRAKNNICFYCHPQWSGTPTRFFDKIEGFCGIEVWNSGCVRDNLMDFDNGWQLDELLAMGHKNYSAFAVDDAHDEIDYCKGWVMVNAENNVKSILKAVEDGAFYSSTGADIYDFYVEDDVCHVKCSDAIKVYLCADKHPSMCVNAKPGETINEATFDLTKNFGYNEYIRIHVVDANLNQAWSNPLWIKK